MTSSTRKDLLAELRSALRAAKSAEELNELLERTSTLLSQRASGATLDDALDYVAQYAGCAALDEAWLEKLVRSGRVESLLRRWEPVDPDVLERLLAVCIERTFSTSIGELGYIDMLRERGVQLSESVVRRCHDALISPKGSVYAPALAARLLIRATNGVTPAMLALALKALGHLPSETARCMTHAAWTREAWKYVEPRTLENLRAMMHSVVMGQLLDVLDGDTACEHVRRMAAAANPRIGEQLARALQEGSAPGLSSLTKDDCVALLESRHAGVRLGAQIHLARLPVAEARHLPGPQSAAPPAPSTLGPR